MISLKAKQESVPYLTSFYLGDKGLQAQIAKKDKKIDADEARRIRLFPNQEDSGFELRVGHLVHML